MYVIAIHLTHTSIPTEKENLKRIIFKSYFLEAKGNNVV